MLPEPVQVDVTTGMVRRRKPDPKPISYPGDAKRVSNVPRLVVG
jgi:hypothetical protein